MTLYKAIDKDNKGPYSDFDFTPYLPHDGQPGEWLPKVDKLEMCEFGWHYADENHIIAWLREQIFEVEVRGEVLDGDNKSTAQEMRLVRKCEGWNERTARLLACEYAERVLPIYEKHYPDDKRPRQAIETARRFANGEATQEELAAAWDAARAAAGAAAWNAARAAAWNAARAAAWAAARNAARAAVGDAARDAARAAAGAAAGAAECKWQNEKLMGLLR